MWRARTPRCGLVSEHPRLPKPNPPGELPRHRGGSQVAESPSAAAAPCPNAGVGTVTPGNTLPRPGPAKPATPCPRGRTPPPRRGTAEAPGPRNEARENAGPPQTPSPPHHGSGPRSDRSNLRQKQPKMASAQSHRPTTAAQHPPPRAHPPLPARHRVAPRPLRSPSPSRDRPAPRGRGWRQIPQAPPSSFPTHSCRLCLRSRSNHALPHPGLNPAPLGGATARAEGQKWAGPLWRVRMLR